MYVIQFLSSSLMVEEKAAAILDKFTASQEQLHLNKLGK